jgi:hypothetical protein
MNTQLGGQLGPLVAERRDHHMISLYPALPIHPRRQQPAKCPTMSHARGARIALDRLRPPIRCVTIVNEAPCRCCLQPFKQGLGSAQPGRPVPPYRDGFYICPPSGRANAAGCPRRGEGIHRQESQPPLHHRQTPTIPSRKPVQKRNGPLPLDLRMFASITPFLFLDEKAEETSG